MRLTTDRLVLRDWALDDAEAAYQIYGDPEVMRYVGTGAFDQSVDETREKLRRVIARDQGQPMGLWAVELLDGGVIGGGLLKPLPDGSDIEVGYHFARQWWGHGYATEVTRALVRYGFEELGLERIVGVTYPENLVSQRVLIKAGLTHAGQSLYGAMPVEFFVIQRTLS